MFSFVDKFLEFVAASRHANVFVVEFEGGTKIVDAVPNIPHMCVRYVLL